MKHFGRTCTIQGCKRPHKARGYCMHHYRQWLKYGEIIRVRLARRDPGRGCKVKGCNRKHYGKDYCEPHYQQYRKHGRITHAKIAFIDSSRGCKVEGCGDKHYAHGYCLRHWYQIKKHGKITSKERTMRRRRPAEPSLPKEFTDSIDEVKSEMLRVYDIIGKPFTLDRFRKIARIDSPIISTREKWNILKAELSLSGNRIFVINF